MARSAALFVASLVAVTIGLSLFARGFFLTRAELKSHSACDDELGTRQYEPAWLDPPPRCWTPSTATMPQRVVLVVIDALRIDFVAPQTLTRLQKDADKQSFYLNKLLVMRDLLRDKPTQTLIARLDADPPTTTLQRLKGLTTGGLPTFIDIKDDVAVKDSIEEDNFLAQIARAGKQTTFMGDDTWAKLFPQGFNRSFPFESFNVKDLDTLDAGVERHLPEELERSDWSLLIAHFLGVDHAGHRYGPEHSEMTRKLLQMDRVLEAMVKWIDQNQDTMLLVIGDHGMTQDGNHGGASEEERSAGLFLYSPVPLPGLSVEGRARIASIDEELRGKEGVPTIEQIDLTPTLALLLGLPVPFGNLGFLEPHVFYQEDGDAALAHLTEMNLAQIVRYLLAYSNATNGQGVPLETLQLLVKAQAEAASIENAWDRLVALRAVARLCSVEARKLWTQFGLLDMAVGSFIACMGTASLLIFVFSQSRIPNLRIFPIGLTAAVVLSLLALTSNSYIVHESSVASYALATAIAVDWVRYRSGLATVVDFGYMLASLGALRLAVSFLGPVMKSSGHEVGSLSLSYLILGMICTILGPGLVAKSSRSSHRTKLLVGVQAVATCLFWMSSTHTYYDRYFARFVFASSLVAFASTGDVSVLYCSLALVLGPSSPPVLLAFVLVASGVRLVYRSDLLFGVALGLCASCAFHATGHACDFGALRVTSPYVGFDEFDYYRGIVMLTVDTFGAHALATGAALFSSVKASDALGGILSVFALRAIVTALFVFAQRRHLMVWAIFAPKFVFDASAWAATVAFALVGIFVSNLHRGRKSVL